MNHREDDWQRDGAFIGPHDPGQPLSLEEQNDHVEPPTHIAVRRVELVARLHHMAFRGAFPDQSLPPAQAGAMRSIIRNPGMSQRELADALHIQRATATVMLQKMEKAGFVLRKPDQEDQRISRIYPTEAAIEVDEETRKAVDTYFARCFQNFTPEEFELFNSLLLKLGENIREQLPISKE